MIQMPVKPSISCGRAGTWLLFLAAISGCFSMAAHAERGFRQIRVFSGREMGGSAQNFDVTQGLDGTLFVANLRGVLEFNGAFWELIELPTRSAAFAVACGKDGALMAGGYNQLGFLERDAYGTTRFRSVMHQLPDACGDFGDVERIYPQGSSFFVMTTRFLFHFSKQGQDVSVRPRHPDTALLYRGEDLFLCHGGQVTALGGASQGSHPPQDGRERFSLGEMGYILDSGEIRMNPGHENRDPESLLAWLSHAQITAVQTMPDDRFLIATRQKGILFVTPDLQPDEVLNLQHGLPDNDVRRVFLSEDGTLWMALNTRLAAMDTQSHVFVFDQRHGLESQVQAMIRHHGRLLLGTQDGVVTPSETKRSSSGLDPVNRIQKVSPEGLDVWAFHVDRDENLVLGTSSGILVHTAGQWTRVPRTERLSTYAFGASERVPETLYVGAREGLRVMQKTGGRWRLLNRVPNTPTQVRSILEMPDGRLWLGTTFDGALRVSHLFDSAGGLASEPVIESLGHGEMDCFQFQNQLCFTHDGRAFALDEDAFSLVPHPVLTPERVPVGFFMATKDAAGNHWFNTFPLTRVFTQEDGRVIADSYSYRNVPCFDVQCFFADDDGSLWLTSENRLIKIEANTSPSRPNPFPSRIGRVTYGSEPLALFGQHPQIPVLAFGPKRMRIEFAPMDFQPNQQFQYRLFPIEEDWSEWSSRPFVEYTNLWEGHYDFQMRARQGGQQVSSAHAFAFRIQAPWYRTKFAIFCYFITSLGAAFAFLKWRLFQLQKQADKLKQTVGEQTRQLEDLLIDLEDAKQQVEQKNQELEEKNRALSQLSRLDGLTGIANRRSLDQVLSEEWKRSWRLQTPISALLVDLDHFKQLNDSLGHLQGDECLKQVALYLRDLKLRSTDLVARYGGEEFIILLPNSELEGAATLAEEVRAGIEQLHITHPTAPSGRITASIGVANMTANPENQSSDLLARSDEALYRAKSDGRNCVRVAREP